MILQGQPVGKDCDNMPGLLMLNVPEPDQRGLDGYCMSLVMRYLLVSRVEKATNNDLKLSLLGSDRPSGCIIRWNH